MIQKLSKRKISTVSGHIGMTRRSRFISKKIRMIMVGWIEIKKAKLSKCQRKEIF